MICIFLGFLVLVNLLNLFISIPIGNPVRIGQEGDQCLRNPGKKWYLLDAEIYAVENSFYEIHSRSSVIPFVTRRYTYFHVLVRTAAEENFLMPVRVRDQKRQRLESGESVSLYGMVSELSGESRKRQETALSGRSASRMCLNDNGDTISKRALSAVFSTFIAAFFGILLIKNMRNP